MNPIQVTAPCEASVAACAHSSAFKLWQLVVTVVPPSFVVRVHCSAHWSAHAAVTVARQMVPTIVNLDIIDAPPPMRRLLKTPMRIP
jgi:hypothetical protein